MRAKHWCALLGVCGTGLTALLLGQTVLGQPDARLPLPPPVALPQPESGPPRTSGTPTAPGGAP